MKTKFLQDEENIIVDIILSPSDYKIVNECYEYNVDFCTSLALRTAKQQLKNPNISISLFVDEPNELNNDIYPDNHVVISFYFEEHTHVCDKCGNINIELEEKNSPIKSFCFDCDEVINPILVSEYETLLKKQNILKNKIGDIMLFVGDDFYEPAMCEIKNIANDFSSFIVLKLNSTKIFNSSTKFFVKYDIKKYFELKKEWDLKKLNKEYIDMEKII